MLCDGRGVPIGAVVTSANTHDLTVLGETLETLDRLPVDRPQPTPQAPQGLCLDKAYDAQIAHDLAEAFDLTPHIRSRGEEQQAKRKNGHKARRWVVERLHSWMNRFRRILIRWEKKTENYTAMLHLACGLISWRAAGLVG